MQYDVTTLSATEVTELLQVNKSTLYRRIKKGTFMRPHRDKMGYFFWYRKDLDPYLDKMRKEGRCP